MLNPVVEGKKKMEEWFGKVELILQENVLVIADIEAKASRKVSDDEFAYGSN